MIIDLLKLRNNIVKEIVIDEFVSIGDNLMHNTELLGIKDVHVSGNLVKNAMDDIVLNLSVSGIMVLECALTLKPVDYPFMYDINGNLEDFLEEIDKKVENTIDILPIIWENILMEIPMRIVSPDAQVETLQGDGWRFVTEGEHNNVNPELEKLKDLL